MKMFKERSQPTETKDDAEARNDFWSLQGDFIYRHHVEPRFELFPLKYIDVARTAHTNLDVLEESRTDDFWNVDVDRNLSDSWTGFTKLTLLRENLQRDSRGQEKTDKTSSNHQT